MKESTISTNEKSMIIDFIKTIDQMTNSDFIKTLNTQNGISATFRFNGNKGYSEMDSTTPKMNSFYSICLDSVSCICKLNV